MMFLGMILAAIIGLVIVADEPAPVEPEPEPTVEVFVSRDGCTAPIHWADMCTDTPYSDGMPAPIAPVPTTEPVPFPPLEECEQEDSVNCFWNACSRGDGNGTSFISGPADADGEPMFIFYLPGMC